MPGVITPEGHGMGWRPKPPDIHDHVLSFKVQPGALPAKVDLRPYNPRIWDQGQLGSCTAFAIARACVTQAKRQSLPVFDPSWLFIYYQERLDMGTVGSDSGASIAESARAVKKYGYPHGDTWPYDIARFRDRPLQAAYDSGLQNIVKQYLTVPQDLNQLKAALAAGYCWSFGFSVFSNFENIGSSGIVPWPTGSFLGGHANCAVGYDDAAQVFICGNSWGEGFGDHGWLYFPYSFVLHPQISADFQAIELVSEPGPTPTPTDQYRLYSGVPLYVKVTA
jgi:C1A family cysteine protease